MSADETPVEVEEATPARAASSIIGTLHAEAEAAAETTTKDLRVGKLLPSLWARYRVLDSEETAELERAARQRRYLRDRTGADDTAVREVAAARLLATACVEMLWMGDDGELVPLADALAAEGVEVDGPLRYNAELVEVLDLGAQLGLGEKPSSVDVVRALHRWGRSSAPLDSTARLLSLWMSGVSAEALGEIIEGM